MHLILFFTYGVSLKTWAKTGLLEREVVLYKKLLENNVRVTFMTYGDSEDHKWSKDLNGIKLIPIYERINRPKNKLLCFLQSFFLPLKFRDILSNADLFKTNQIKGGWTAVVAKWLYGKPLLARCGHDYYWFARKDNEHKLKLLVIRLLSLFTYKYSDQIHVATVEDSTFIQKEFRIPKNKIHIQSNWIDTEDLYVNNNAVRINNSIIYVGRLTAQKNIPLLFRALKNTPYKLDIIGTGDEENTLKKEAIKFSENIRFLGRVPNAQLRTYYCNYPVYVLCSHFEGNPKTLLEAMACGCAVIGTDVPGIRNIIEHNKNGLLCSNSSESVRDAINLLMKNPKLREKLASQARSDIVQKNSISQFIERELNYYNEIISSI